MAKILVVDDNSMITDLFTKILSSEGHEVLTASSGTQCLAVMENMEKDAVNLIFLDLKLPDISGENVLKELTMKYASTPVVIVTGHGNLEKWMDLHQQKIACYVRKPFNIEYIKVLVRNILSFSKRNLPKIEKAY